jgi:hypothetical protein
MQTIYGYPADTFSSKHVGFGIFQIAAADEKKF